MQTIWRSAAIADQVKSEFAISAFHAIINFTRWNFSFSHHNFKMPDQGFHLRIYI